VCGRERERGRAAGHWNVKYHEYIFWCVRVSCARGLSKPDHQDHSYIMRRYIHNLYNRYIVECIRSDCRVYRYYIIIVMQRANTLQTRRAGSGCWTIFCTQLVLYYIIIYIRILLYGLQPCRYRESNIHNNNRHYKYIILKCAVINTLIVTRQHVSRCGTNCRGVKMISEHIIHIAHQSFLFNYTRVVIMQL